MAKERRNMVRELQGKRSLRMCRGRGEDNIKMNIIGIWR
jgi:hypothetical protein